MALGHFAEMLKTRTSTRPVGPLFVQGRLQSGRTGGLLRRSPLRTARAAFTASSSSKPRGRLRCVVLFPSCAAVKIRCRSRRTWSSWCRQSTASHERVASSGPFTIWCLTCPSVPALGTASLHRLTCPRQRPFRGPGTRPGIQPVIQQRRPGGAIQGCAGFLSAFARRHSLLGHPVPAREFRSPHSRPTDPPPGAARTLSGFPCSARMRCDRVGCLLYPGAAVSSRPAQPLRSAPAASQRPALYPAETSHRRSC